MTCRPTANASFGFKPPGASTTGNDPGSQIILVQNWVEELTRLVPVN